MQTNSVRVGRSPSSNFRCLQMSGLSDAVLGCGKYTRSRAVVPLLEGGFPKIDELMGGRYWPAVKAFLNTEYRIDANYDLAARGGHEALGSYRGKGLQAKEIAAHGSNHRQAKY
jgi:hypothetical protein